MSQPKDQTVVIGSPTMFSGSAVGNQPLVYQWYFNNALLGGATSSNLLISPSLANEVRTYQLVVTNAYGSITSRLTVLNIMFLSNSYAVSNSGGGQRTIFLGSYPSSTNRLWTTTNLLIPSRNGSWSPPISRMQMV